jgi:hypothetical protein
MTESPDAGPLSLLSRRDAIRRASALLGVVAFVGGSRLLSALETRDVPAGAVTGAGAPGAFTAAHIALLDEIAETILPATNTPGAKAAATGAFMAVMVTDAYSPAERAVFLDGMRQLDLAMHEAYGATFMEATPPQRLELLAALDRDQQRAMDAAEADHPVPYFRMMKQLALLGYFTSKIGCTQAQRYVETPGRYDPCVPYAPGEPAWALHA